MLCCVCQLVQYNIHPLDICLHPLTLYLSVPSVYQLSPNLLYLLMRLVGYPQTNSPHMNHSTNTVPTIIPASLNMATLFPLAAIRPSLLAEPFKFVLIEENVPDYILLASTP
jgi:hypothetical protein